MKKKQQEEQSGLSRPVMFGFGFVSLRTYSVSVSFPCMPFRFAAFSPANRAEDGREPAVPHALGERQGEGDGDALHGDHRERCQVHPRGDHLRPRGRRAVLPHDPGNQQDTGETISRVGQVTICCSPSMSEPAAVKRLCKICVSFLYRHFFLSSLSPSRANCSPVLLTNHV